MQLPRRTRLAASLCAAGLAGLCAGARAETTFKVSGYGTLGAAISNRDETAFRQGVNQYEGVTKRLDFGVDSRAAVQTSANFSPTFSVTTQIIARRYELNDVDTKFEWAYAQYTGFAGFDLKGGRVVLPAFLLSDSRNVGYSMPWLRVSPLVYSMMPLSSVDGAQVTYRHNIGDAIATLQFTRGSANGVSRTVIEPVAGLRLNDDAPDIQTSNIVGLNASLEWGDWMVRVAQIKDHTNLTELMISFLPDGSPSPQPGQEFKDSFHEFGVQYDNGKYLVAAEYVTRRTNTGVATNDAWYVGGGYHFGSVMPYVMVSRQTEKSLYMRTRPQPATPGLAIGTRWDFANNLALKGEWATYKANSLYTFTDGWSDAALNKRVNVMSVALDFVF